MHPTQACLQQPPNRRQHRKRCPKQDAHRACNKLENILITYLFSSRIFREHRSTLRAPKADALPDCAMPRIRFNANERVRNANRRVTRATKAMECEGHSSDSGRLRGLVPAWTFAHRRTRAGTSSLAPHRPPSQCRKGSAHVGAVSGRLWRSQHVTRLCSSENSDPPVRDLRDQATPRDRVDSAQPQEIPPWLAT